MSKPENPHYSEFLQLTGQWLGRKLRNKPVAGPVIRAATGSAYPNFRPIDWQSYGIKKSILFDYSAPGDPGAGWLQRSWSRAMILGAKHEELEELRSRRGSAESRDALAYWGGSLWHVGSLATERSLFTEFDDEELIALRIGRGLLTATMGIQQENTFVSDLRTLRRVKVSVPFSALESDYPDIILV